MRVTWTCQVIVVFCVHIYEQWLVPLQFCTEWALRSYLASSSFELGKEGKSIKKEPTISCAFQEESSTR